MARKLKVLCKIKKSEIESLWPDIMDVVIPAKFVCHKCLRTANEKKWLCKPTKID